MPVTINIGLSRTTGEGGATINIELELDPALVSEPDKLQGQIRQLLTVVRGALAEQGNSPTPDDHQNIQEPDPDQTISGEGNASTQGSPQRSGPQRPATPSQ